MASVSSFPAAEDRLLPSSGHNSPYWSGIVHINEVLSPLYPHLSPDTSIPEGAIALETHQDLSGNPQQIFAMEKRAPGFDPGGGDWEYLVITPEGAVESRGVLQFCARCHAEAPYDHLFGPRLSTRRHILQTSEASEPRTEVEEDGAVAPDENTSPGASKSSSPKKKRRK